MTDRPTHVLERRSLLRAVGAGAAGGVAGCLGGGPSANGSDGDSDGSPPQVYEPTMENVDEGPFEFPEGHGCAVCSMPATDYPGRKGQLVHENGLAAVFDSPGCLFAYKVSSTPDSPIAGAWTTDYETGSLIDATAAHFVLITDEQAAEDPMGIDPRPFAAREDATAFLEEWTAEELTEDDVIVGLEPVDMEIAAIYRGNRLPTE
ncbi:nitrous oxide reductase accessory protein NosL [Natrinema sp. 1APR25-10V2]|uniref:nitrous oxide reductase accessory protein NosL n=1 Tax=Natrinema sp. 1APR25-10V2 TaxID=2951081 RepID=UPI0028753FA3|nr:nitrous oxide reductase accessory protein NosL [Natrinema sp. 1APR25-10V2]MDS0477669.1 nitrous oxide reductase accessory protein NosL [Natrinema sp. 1APR25-10V2]